MKFSWFGFADFRKFMSLRSQMISKLWTLWIHVLWQFWKSLKILSSHMGSAMSIGILLLDIPIHCLVHHLMVYWHFGFILSSFVLNKDSKFYQRQARYLFKIFPQSLLILPLLIGTLNILVEYMRPQLTSERHISHRCCKLPITFS